MAGFCLATGIGLWLLARRARVAALFILWFAIFVVPFGVINPFTLGDWMINGYDPQLVYLLALVIPVIVVGLAMIHIIQKHKGEFRSGWLGSEPALKEEVALTPIEKGKETPQVPSERVPLKEMLYVKQQEGQDRCRWFSDEYFDLYVWDTPAGEVTGFQLCYDKQTNERAITWFIGLGFSHSKVDQGDQVPTKNRAPILVRNGLFPYPEVLRRFEANSTALDANLAAFVIAKLKEYQSLPESPS